MQGDGLVYCAYTLPVFVGSNRQQFLLEVDTGSSDTWLVSNSCTSDPACSTFTGPKYDPSNAQPTGQNFGEQQQHGIISGPIVQDTIEIGGYVVKGQALAAATSVQNEILSMGAGFSGSLGLDLQANSVIARAVASSSPPVDNSTFTTHLFSNTTSNNGASGLTTPGPSNQFISLLLERPFYPGLASYLGIGAHPPLPYSLNPSQVTFSDILPSDPGPLYWRIPLTRVSADIGGTTQYMSLGSTGASGVSSIYPVAVVDSSGSGMMATRSFANAFYGMWGVGPGKDDNQYYVPCNLSMNVTMTIGSGVSIDVPIHPLDMSMPIPTDPNNPMCLGSLQATDSSMPQGDLIIGPSFLRNVYTVLSYQTNPPRLGILPFTNPANALSEFNLVRVNHQQIGSGLSPSQANGSAMGNNAHLESDSKSTKIGVKVLIGVSVFLIIAGLIIFLSVRTLKRRWTRKAEEDQHQSLPDPELSGKEKRAAVRGVFGIADGEEAFAMFGRVVNTNGNRRTDNDADSMASNRVEQSPTTQASPTDTIPKGDGEETNTKPGKTHTHHRFRRPPYQSVDSVWGSGSMSGLIQDTRYASMYSVHSGISSFNRSEVDIAAMKPVEEADGYNLGPVSPIQRTASPDTMDARVPPVSTNPFEVMIHQAREAESASPATPKAQAREAPHLPRA
ncbi:hypothetical protein FRB99_001750 [Tulasnella sp. 403]|nr:hypothetical protein FRB99_001750 [Tulasnella sp. 403]